MVNNQDEFNNKFSKEKTEIKLKNKNFSGQLVIKDYSSLEKFNLRNVKNVDKVILQNLTQLQECTVYDCGVQELVIENCPQIKELDISDNSLTNLEFLIKLTNLEVLKLERNDKLVEILKPYQGDWKAYQKDVQEIFELVKQNSPEKLAKKFWDLKKSREDLKKNIKKIHRKTVSGEMDATKEIVSNLEKEFKIKEEKINYLEFRLWELTELSEKQVKQIQDYLENFCSEKELLMKLIKAYIEFIKFKKQEINSLDYDEKYSEYEKQYKKLEEQLWTKLTKEKRSEARRVLIDCEKLVDWELESGIKLKDKSSLIEEKKYDPEITNNSEKKIKLKEQEDIQQSQLEKRKSLLLSKLEGKLEAKNEEIARMDKYLERPTYKTISNVLVNQEISNTIVYQIQYNQALANQELIEFKQRYYALEPINETSSDLQKLKKTIFF